MTRLKVFVLYWIQKIDPDTARRMSRGWGWHVVAFLALLYVLFGLRIRESIDNLVLFIGVSAVAVSLGYQASVSFFTRPFEVDLSHPLWVEHRRYRALLLVAFVISAGMFF